jgi:FRG domain
MIKAEIISSYEDFEVLIKKVQERRSLQVLGLAPFKQEYYRGQSKNIDSYKLKPTIARKITDAKALKETEFQVFEELKNVISAHDKGQFIRKSPDNYKFLNDWELLWQAQHLELPTRLMDWAIEFQVALFFAVGNPKNDDFDGQFWILSVEEKYQDDNYSYLDYNPFEYQKTTLLNPYFNDTNDFNNHHGEMRRMRQYGRFLFQNHSDSLIPLEEQEAFIPFLEKYIIPKENKEAIRTKLVELNRTEEVLLPKIDKGLREEIEKIKKNKNI